MSLNGNRFKTTNERQPCPVCLGYLHLLLCDGRLVPTLRPLRRSGNRGPLQQRENRPGGRLSSLAAYPITQEPIRTMAANDMMPVVSQPSVEFNLPFARSPMIFRSPLAIMMRISSGGASKPFTTAE